MLFRLRPNPVLVTLILDSLPAEVWTSTSTVFIDPAMGSGQFVTEIERRLRAHGHSDSNISSRVFGLESNQMEVAIAVNMNGLVGSYRKDANYSAFLNGELKRLLGKDCPVKFHVVIGNPPYQAPNNVSTKLWPQFTAAAFDCLATDGYLAFVTPTSWTQPLSDKPSNMNQRTNDIMFGNSLLYCDLDANRFFNVGVDISAYVLKKDGKASPVRYMVRRHPKVAVALLGQANRGRFVNADTTVWGRHATVTEATSEFCVPLRTKKGIVYSDRDDHTLRSQPKVIIPRDLGYFPQCDKQGQYGFNWQARAHLCSSTFEAESAFSVYNSKLIRWAIKNFSWVPQTDYTLLSMLKLPPFDRVWTDTELLEFYGLSEDDLS